MVDGLMNMSVWGYIIVTLVFTHITIAAVTIYLHRCQAHMGLELHPVVSHFFRFWLWMTTGMVTRDWVAVHRKHHAKVETEDDPHSPMILGINKVMWEGAELYRESAADQEMVKNYSHNTPTDWIENNFYLPYTWLGLRIMLVVNFILFGFGGITIWAIQMMWIPVMAAGIINGYGHHKGYRNYESADTSTNLTPWGILIGGEELHNNHHAFASSAKFSSKWWEFDIGWMYITIMSFFGLARVKKVAPRPVQGPRKTIDVDTLMAIINNRLHVMSCYARDVVARVHKDELSAATDKGLFIKAKQLLTRNDFLMDDNARGDLANALSESDALQVVYQFKLRLQEIWQERSATQEALVKSLQDWCHQAEETGIQSLQDFARSLQGYTMQPVRA